jgi:nucleoside-diphosphate-sugar epimerase
LADISLAREIINFQPKVDLENGLIEYVNWARLELKNK